jgi:hypothetical protein
MPQESKENFLEDIPIENYLKDIPYLTDIVLAQTELFFLQYPYLSQGMNLSAMPRLPEDGIRL